MTALENRPELDEYLWIYWQAFWELSSSRSVGLALNPITIEDIEAWLRIHRIEDADDRQTMLSTIKSMDALYLNEVSKKCQRSKR